MTKRVKKIRPTSKDDDKRSYAVIMDDLNDDHSISPETVELYSKWIEEVLFPQKSTSKDD